jgi:hypothetical protein
LTTEFPEVVAGSEASPADVPTVTNACEWIEDNDEVAPEKSKTSSNHV